MTGPDGTVKDPPRDVGGKVLWLLAAVLRLGGRGAAGGHADGQPDRQEPRRHPNRSARAGPHPRRIQAWREVNELPDRELMRDGRWLV
ncbi:MAG TPA: hypothetical protein VFD59_20040 [Nocardioidaceae bacterium]|nr:hypothetical protein [Nocardioidaceae bacterium]